MIALKTNLEFYRCTLSNFWYLGLLFLIFRKISFFLLRVIVDPIGAMLNLSNSKISLAESLLIKVCVILLIPPFPWPKLKFRF